MTVAEIKEYITQKINYYKGENYYHTLPTNTVLLDFEQIGIMLDQLDTEWVSVDDRLPKESGLYIVTVHDLKEDDIFVDPLNYDVNLGWNYFREFRIIAWRPLPQPYKRKENK